MAHLTQPGPILSALMSFIGPLGFLVPFALPLKLLVQEIVLNRKNRCPKIILKSFPDVLEVFKPLPSPSLSPDVLRPSRWEKLAYAHGPLAFPVLDEESGLLGVCSRLREAQVSFPYPAVLPKNGHLSELLVNEAHLAVEHQCTDAVVSLSRRNSGCSSPVRSVPLQTLQCWSPKSTMADLPADRVCLDEPFFDVAAVDLSGHFFAKLTCIVVATTVRTCTVKTSTSTFVRPIVKLALLEAASQ